MPDFQCGKLMMDWTDKELAACFRDRTLRKLKKVVDRAHWKMTQAAYAERKQATTLKTALKNFNVRMEKEKQCTK